MTFAVNRIIIYFSILLFCIGHTAGKCPENMLDCCGNCYNPGSEECIKSGDIDCKIVEKSISEIPRSNPQPKEADVENIYDLITEGKIAVEARGSSISSLSLKIEPKVDLNIKVSIPPGTLFSADRGSSQSMISTEGVTVELEVEPGLDVSVEEKDQPDNENWKYVDVPVACANLHKAIPESADTFKVERSPNQEELEKLLPVLEAVGASYPVKQAAIWIITDDASYSDLGTLVSGGDRVIKEYEAAEAMRLIGEAGIDISNKAIWEDRDKISEGNTGKPTGYVEGAGTMQSCRTCPEGWSGPGDDCKCWKCEDCPAGWEGPNEKCECWRWEAR